MQRPTSLYTQNNQPIRCRSLPIPTTTPSPLLSTTGDHPIPNPISIYDLYSKTVAPQTQQRIRQTIQHLPRLLRCVDNILEEFATIQNHKQIILDTYIRARGLYQQALALGFNEATYALWTDQNFVHNLGNYAATYPIPNKPIVIESDSDHQSTSYTTDNSSTTSQRRRIPREPSPDSNSSYNSARSRTPSDTEELLSSLIRSYIAPRQTATVSLNTDSQRPLSQPEMMHQALIGNTT